jgi:hypothetical protein
MGHDTLVMLEYTIVLEGHAASIFTSYHIITWCFNPEDSDMDLHCHEKLKSYITELLNS